MVTDTDNELARRYARDDAGSEQAFAELVRRHVDLVYSVARRQVRSRALAEEVAQSVFVDLARQIRRSVPDGPFGPWLYVVARRTGVDVARREMRLQLRDSVASEIHAMNTPSTTWRSIEPLLDEAVASLSTMDRGAIVMRFFENKSLREIGQAFGISENAAQKRIGRSLDQLRSHFTKRGITMGSSALASELACFGTQTAPAGLSAVICAAANTTAVSTTAIALTMTALQKTLVAAAFAGAIGFGLYESHRASQATARLLTLQQASEAQGTRIEAPESSQAIGSAAEPTRSSEAASVQITPVGNPMTRERLEEAFQMSMFIHTAIPELKLLGDEDWSAVIAAGDFETEEGFRIAMARARYAAKMKLAPVLGRAVRNYVAANEGMLPSSIWAIKDHLEPGIDDEILTRYEMIHRGLAAENRGRTWILERPDEAYDREYDFRLQVSEGTFRFDSGMTMKLAVSEALFRFMKDNPGVPPHLLTVTDIQPYLPVPVSPRKLQEILSQERGYRY